MTYTAMLRAIRKELGEAVSYGSRMATATELWGKMYRGHAPWNSDKVLSAGIAASVASETARLVTTELACTLTGSALIEDVLSGRILPELRRQTEYGLAGGSLIIKPIASEQGLSAQFIRAGRFFPLAFDADGALVRCVFTDQFRDGSTVFTLLEIHTLDGDVLTVKNRLYRSSSDQLLGSPASLSTVSKWADLAPEAQFSGAARLPVGLFRVPLANNIDEDSPLGVSTFARASELIYEADRRYSDICWEYEAKQAAVHIADSLLEYDKTRDTYQMPDGRDRLYRKINTDSTADKPLIDVYSPEIRSSQYFDGYNAQLRMVEFACSLAYGTLSDPNTVDKTAEEIRSSKQRSYVYVRDCQAALEQALRDWADASLFWARVYGLERSGSIDMQFVWGDSILSDPDKEREEDRKDLANGTLRPEEYRAKYRMEDLDTAKANLPDTPGVML